MRREQQQHGSCYCCSGLALALAITICASGCCVRSILAAEEKPIRTPLDDYVDEPDSHYSWFDTGKRVTGIIPLRRWEGVVLNMTSQQWLPVEDVDCSIWTHYLVVVRPGNYEYKKTALLIIGGGTDSGEQPSATDETLLLGATIAVQTKSLVAVLYQVPNQPCQFAAERPQRQRSEDDLIAYTWAHFLKHPDENYWPLRLPMTKAAVRAMDTVQAYAARAHDITVENFVVAGASKRGWTTWTTAATDNRVVGIIPIVMDTLNFFPNMHHIYRGLGGWPFLFEPYYDMNLTSVLDTREFGALMDIVDPFKYKDRLTMPKLVISSSNDEFFQIDDGAYFWDELAGEKHMLILSNTEHSLLTGLPKMLVAIESFFLSIVEGHELSKTTSADPSAASLRLRGKSVSEPDPLERRVRARSGVRPEYWWNISRPAGTIEVGTAENPVKAILWYAYTQKSTKGRDFRWFTADSGNCPTVAVNGLCLQPVFFRKRTLRASAVDRGRGVRKYVASIPTPEVGFGAFFVELRFSGPTWLRPFIFTTGAAIVPNVFPFEDCHGSGCKGTLL